MLIESTYLVAKFLRPRVTVAEIRIVHGVQELAERYVRGKHELEFDCTDDHTSIVEVNSVINDLRDKKIVKRIVRWKDNERMELVNITSGGLEKLDCIIKYYEKYYPVLHPVFEILTKPSRPDETLERFKDIDF